MAERYPAAYPLPLRDSYAYTVDTGYQRHPMDSGTPRQRRDYANYPHYFRLEFAVKIDNLKTWQTWVNNYAYDWFELPLVNAITIGLPLCANYCLVRFTGSLAISALSGAYVTVAVDAELQPGQQNLNPGAHTWILGGIPLYPNSQNWVIGGTPAAPSPDWVYPLF